MVTWKVANETGLYFPRNGSTEKCILFFHPSYLFLRISSQISFLLASLCLWLCLKPAEVHLIPKWQLAGRAFGAQSLSHSTAARVPFGVIGRVVRTLDIKSAESTFEVDKGEVQVQIDKGYEKYP